MKTTKPLPVVYKANYAAMTITQRYWRLIPAPLMRHFAARLMRRSDIAESTRGMHPDRYDMVVDWGCVAWRLNRKAQR